MTDFKSHFKFNKQERSGIFFLLLLIFVFQLVLFIVQGNVFGPKGKTLAIDEKTQEEIAHLKEMKLIAEEKIALFNPNYISDFKGYTLGMSPEEIDRLLRFRAKGNYIHSASEFQQITGISDSLLMSLSPAFRFPDWKTYKVKPPAKTPSKKEGEIGRVYDLNLVTVKELREVRGIGEVLSARIIKFREALGGFLVEEQLYDVYGLEDEVVLRLLNRARIINKPTVHKINLNEASANELASLVYINSNLAQKMVLYRTQNGAFKSFDELAEIPEFPSVKIDRIKLYLSL